MYVSQHHFRSLFNVKIEDSRHAQGIINASKAQCGRYMYTGINGI